MRPPQRSGLTNYDEADERAARRTLWLLVAGASMLVVGLVVFLTVRTLRQSDDGSASPSPVITTPEDAARVVGGIGPPQGTDVPAYITARKQALTEVVDARVAVVSLTKYMTEPKARAIAGSAEVLGLLAAAPGGQPSLVSGDIPSWVNAQTAEARAERDEIQRLIPTAQNDPAFQAFYRTEIDRLNKLVSAIRPNGELVFAVVVRAPGPVLAELGRNPEVRLVDAGPTADPGPKPVYRGLRPEETATANEPNTRPV